MACHSIRTLLYGNSTKTRGNNVCFLDLCYSKDCENDIQKAVRNFVPDVTGISIRNIDDTGGYSVHFLLEDVKNDVIDYCKKFPGPVVIGVPSAGINGREMLVPLSQVTNGFSLVRSESIPEIK